MLKNITLRKVIPAILALAMVFGGCAPKTETPPEGTTKAPEATNTATSGDTATAAPDPSKPATFIADRTVDCQIYIDDVGASMPTDQEKTRMNAELKKRTGMTINFMYTSGASDLEVMTTAISSGSLPELIGYYLDDSSRPEFPILLKAAREEVFLNVAPLLANTKIYSKYSQADFLGLDTKDNVMFRPEFNGGAYIVPLSVKRKADDTVDLDNAYIGGMYIQKKIADALAIDPKTIRTEEQLYDLLVKIKNGNFKDDNGNPVYPLGPKYWGGSIDSIQFILNNYIFGKSSNMNITADGKVLHEAETDYVYKQIDFVRKLLAEGLINPEYFTMDGTRAQEVSNSGNSAIIGDTHNYVDLFKNKEYLLVGPMNDFLGTQLTYTKGKNMNRGWSISSQAKNPEQIVALLDYLATREGKLLWKYGIEGEDYDLVNGNPVPKQAIFDMNAEGKAQELRDSGFSYGGMGFGGYSALCDTDVDNVEDFGEANYGSASNAEDAKAARKISHDNPPTNKIVNGFPAGSFLADLPAIEPQLTQVLNNTAYGEMKVQAFFAKSDDEVKNIVENYRTQLKAAGIEEFEKYLAEKYAKDSNSIYFIK